jgi:hypothetical protein
MMPAAALDTLLPASSVNQSSFYNIYGSKISIVSSEI